MKFEHLETGEVIDVDFEQSIQMDVLGCIEVDGQAYRRCDSLSQNVGKVEKIDRDSVSGLPKRIPPSDSLGFTKHQLDAFEADRVKHGFSGIEFKKDPREPTFYQVHFASEKERQKYIKHRQFTDMNRHKGVSISPAQLKAAEERAREG